MVSYVTSIYNHSLHVIYGQCNKYIFEDLQGYTEIWTQILDSVQLLSSYWMTVSLFEMALTSDRFAFNTCLLQVSNPFEVQ